MPQFALGRSLSSRSPVKNRATAMMAATTLDDRPWPGQPTAMAMGSGSFSVIQRRTAARKTMRVPLCFLSSFLSSNPTAGMLLTLVGKMEKRTAQITSIIIRVRGRP